MATVEEKTTPICCSLQNKNKTAASATSPNVPQQKQQLPFISAVDSRLDPPPKSASSKGSFLISKYFYCLNIYLYMFDVIILVFDLINTAIVLNCSSGRD